jgi:predicted permease
MLDWASYVRANLRLPGLRPERDAEIVEDLARQLDDAYHEALGAGANQDEARLRAEQHITDWAALSRELSATPRGKQSTVEQWQQHSEDLTIQQRGRFTMFTDFRQDVLYGFRTLRKNPGVTGIAILSLALAIGANTAIFSVINALLLRNLPVRDPQQLVVLSDPEAEGAMQGLATGIRPLFTFHEYEGMRDNSNVFSGTLAFSSPFFSAPVAVNGGDAGDPALFTLASANYFSVLGSQPLMGRTFDPDVDQGRMAHAQAVLSYAFWQRHMQSDPAAIGKKIRIRQTLFDVIGVMPPDFSGIVVGASPDIWIPLTMQQAVRPGPDMLTQQTGAVRRIMFLHIVGRLKPGVNLAQANAAINIVYHQGLELDAGSISDAVRGKQLRDSKIDARDARHGLSSLRGEYKKPLAVLMALVGLLLLLACANVANLLLARASGRQREFAVRVSLGAGRARLVRQMLTESVMLSASGAVLGLLLAYAGDRLLLRMVSGGANPIPLDVRPDTMVLLFTIAVAIVTGVLFGLVPALNASRPNLNHVLRGTSRSISGGGGGSSRFPLGKVLVGAQVAISLLLLVTAGLFVRSLEKLSSVPLGYDADHIVMFRMSPRNSGYTQPAIAPLFDQLLMKLNTIPGVRGATLSDNGLFYGYDSGDDVSFAGLTLKSGQDTAVALDSVGPRYFETVGIPILMGRDVEKEDSTGVRGTWLNQSMSKYFFGSENPIGHPMTVHYSFGDVDYVIRGVVADSRPDELRGDVTRRAYTPYFQSATKSADAIFEVRYTGDATSVTSEIRNIVRQTDAGLDPLVFRTLPELLGTRLTGDKLTARLASFFGVLALVLASIGLYGVLSYNVTRRTGEIGMRIALGAQRGNVIAMILREALIVTVLGAAVGLAAALAATRIIVTLLYGVTPRDPVTLAAAAGVLLAVAALAAAIPAWRASRTDPITALRYE